MLPRQYLGRREQRALLARLHRHEQRIERDDRLARPDIALQQAQHRRILRQIVLDLRHAAPLCCGWRERQFERVAQPPIARHRMTAPCLQRLAH